MDAVAGRISCPLSLSSSYQWTAGSPAPSRAAVVVRGTTRRDGKHKAVRCEQAPECITSNCQTMQRREVIGQALLAMSMSFALPARSATDTDAATEFTTYEDVADKYTLLVPQAWNKGEGKTSGQRKVTAFYPADGGLTNVNIVITGLGADFTSLGSFGTADNFAENLVNSLDRSWQKPPGQKARLVDCKSRADKYYVEYTLQRPGEQQRHLLSVVGIGNNGWVNRLYTVTGQYFEEDSAKYKQNINKGFSFPKVRVTEKLIELGELKWLCRDAVDALHVVRVDVLRAAIHKSQDELTLFCRIRRTWLLVMWTGL